MDKDNKENKNKFEPVEPLDITRRKSPDPSAETSAPAGEPQPSPSGDAEPSGGAEPAADASAPAVPAPSDGEGAPAPSAKPPEKKGKKEKKEKQEKSAEEKAAARKRRLTLSGRIARSTLWYPLRITLFVLVKALTYLLNIFFTVLIVGMITGVVVGCAFLLYIKGNIDPEYDGLDNLKFDSSLNTTISYVDPETGLEQTAVTLHGSENRLWAEYKEIPEQLINAFIAIEDQRFYSHKGFDVKRTLGAVLNFIMPGGDRYGGSTITQQLIKVVSQDDDATIQRKVQEIFRAINVETKFSKEEILEMYLNVINLSQNCNGVKTAAQTYFGKSLDGFTPMGPCIVTEDEIPYPPALSISSTVNGELRQNSNTKCLLHSISEIIAELSQGMTLLAGTIIATGTPAGVGMGFDPPKFLKSGDVVTCEIEKIGRLTNMVK